MLKKLDWMTTEDYEVVHYHWACVCEYEKVWTDDVDYEAWCKRVVARYN